MIVQIEQWLFIYIYRNRIYKSQKLFNSCIFQYKFLVIFNQQVFFNTQNLASGPTGSGAFLRKNNSKLNKMQPVFAPIDMPPHICNNDYVEAMRVNKREYRQVIKTRILKIYVLNDIITFKRMGCRLMPTMEPHYYYRYCHNMVDRI